MKRSSTSQSSPSDPFASKKPLKRSRPSSIIKQPLKRSRPSSIINHILKRSQHPTSTAALQRQPHNCRHHFDMLRPLLYYETNQAPSEPKVNLDALETPSPITELIAAGHLMFALTQAGACAAYCRTSGKRLCYLNVKSDETVRSIFLNKQNDSVITVSVYKKDQYRQLRCRST
mgnify:CR=1 FL=1